MSKYDISTLLALRHNSRAEIEQFRAQALANTMPKQRKANLSALSERSANRSRETSNLSFHSQAASTVSKRSYRFPARQPTNPPRGDLAQSDVGFARFLKQHASPRHKRVTAGGRIVPMDPSTPTPKMNLEAAMQDTRAHGSKITAPPHEYDKDARKRSAHDVEKDPNASNVSKASSIPADVLADQMKLPCGNAGLNQYLQASGLFPSIPPTSVTPAMFMQPNFPLSLGNQPQADQSAQEGLKVLQNCAVYGLGDQFAWFPNTNQSLGSQNSAGSFISTSGQSHPSGSGSSSEFSGCNNFAGMGVPALSSTASGFDAFYPVFGASGYPFLGNQLSVPNQSLPPQGQSQGAADLATLPGAAKEYEALSTQLSRLDRHMAVHTWDLDPHSKKLLVDQRMSLVRELDAIRLYKEQLESVFGQAKSGSAKSRKKSHTQGSAGYAPPGVFANNQATDVSGTSAYTAPVTLSGPMPTITFQPGLSVNDHFPTAFQWQSGGNLYPFDNSIELGHMGAGSELSYETGKSYQEVAHTAPRLRNPRAQAPGTNSTDADNLGTCDELKTPTKSATSDIGQIYRRVEEASKCGAPLDGLLQELASATAKLVQQAGEQQGPQQVKPKQGSNASDQPKLSTPVSKGVKQPIERRWKSEDGPNTLANSSGNTSHGTDGECGAGSWSTTSSTDGSWATIPEGGSSNMSEPSKAQINEENKDCPNQHALPPAGPVTAQPAKLDEIVNFSQKKATRDTARESGSESTRHSGSQMLTGYFDKDPTTGSRKSAALAVSQTVNAQAFVPPLDGPADSAGVGESNQGAERPQGNASSQNEARADPNQPKKPWYMPIRRPKPSPAVLREFFRRIEQEERNVVSQYQNIETTPWRMTEQRRG